MKILPIAFFAALLFSDCLFAQDIRLTDFHKADSVASLYPNHSLRELKSLTDKLTAPFSSPVEKFRAIYTWVCLNIENDYPLYLQNRQMHAKLKSQEELDAWNKKLSAIVFKNLLEKQKTVCTGYAYLVREMASLAGINSVIVDGYGRTVEINVGGNGVVNHSWNAVQLNNAWYLCDPTWSGGGYDTEKSEYVKEFDPSYFLADADLFVRSHYPLDSAWMLMKNKPTLSEFLNGPVVYRSAFRYNIHPLNPETLNITTNKGQKISFQFTTDSNRSMDKVVLQVAGARIRGAVHQIRPGVFSIDHKFTARGIFDVHLQLDDYYIFTYTVKVN